jgi:hypothetical protein
MKVENSVYVDLYRRFKIQVISIRHIYCESIKNIGQLPRVLSDCLSDIPSFLRS